MAIVEIFVNRKKICEGKLCKSFLSKAFGLMFQLNKKCALFFYNKNIAPSFHMFFVFHNLKLISLNDRKEVIEIIDMKPWKIYKCKKKSKIFIEVPNNINIKIGDKVEWRVKK